MKKTLLDLSYLVLDFQDWYNNSLSSKVVVWFYLGIPATWEFLKSPNPVSGVTCGVFLHVLTYLIMRHFNHFSTYQNQNYE